MSLWWVSIYPPQWSQGFNGHASLLSEVCSDVGVEPALQPLDGEPLQFATANSEDGARLDVAARDFWGRNRQRAFFDVRVFNPFAHSIFAPNCPDVTIFMNMKKDWHMMNVLERLRELAFHHWCLQLLVAWGPLPQQFSGSLLQCWLRSVALITANAYSGCDVGFAFHC